MNVRLYSRDGSIANTKQLHRCMHKFIQGLKTSYESPIDTSLKAVDKYTGVKTSLYRYLLTDPIRIRSSSNTNRICTDIHFIASIRIFMVHDILFEQSNMMAYAILHYISLRDWCILIAISCMHFP